MCMGMFMQAVECPALAQYLSLTQELLCKFIEFEVKVIFLLLLLLFFREGNFGIYTLRLVPNQQPTWKISCISLHRLNES